MGKVNFLLAPYACDTQIAFSIEGKAAHCIQITQYQTSPE
jgi:hypothetical protein